MSSFDRALDDAKRRILAQAAAQEAEDQRLGAAQQDATRRAQALLPDVGQAIAALVRNPHRQREAEIVAARSQPPTDADFYLNRSLGTLISPSLDLTSQAATVTTRVGRWKTQQETRRDPTGWHLHCTLIEHPLFQRVALRSLYRPTGERVMEHRGAGIEVQLDGGAAVVTGGTRATLHQAASRGIIRWVTQSSSGSEEPNLVDVGAIFEVAIQLVAAYIASPGPRQSG